MEKCIAPNISEFVEALSPVYPLSYSDGLKWYHDEDLPTWPRTGQERIRVRIGERLKKFLKTKGINAAEYEQFIRNLSRVVRLSQAS